MAQLRADPGVLQSVVDAARAGSPQVGALPEQEVRRHIAALLTAVATAFLDTGGLDREQLRAAALLAADRAVQGVPLAALLDGFRAARTQVFRCLAERLDADRPDPGQAAPALPDLVEVMVELDAYAGELQQRLIVAYQQTELRLLAAGRAARIQALREVLVDGALDRLAAAGLDPHGRYHLLLGEVTDPQQAPLTDGTSALVEGYLCTVSVRPVAARAELSVSSPPLAAPQLPTGYRLARSALAAARRRGRTGTHRLTELALPVATDAAADLGPLLAADLLAGLDPLDPAHHRLARTALAYLDRGSRIDRTAAALHLHPNTVKHRLRRLADLTPFGQPPPPDDTVSHTLHWHWALSSWLTRPH
ncbi:PucR family transcriptional regulator [Streptomyces tateyamensis]|uniref:PucR family transcriptional regulator n=2 Tax=Streptomyces tateyamensis TaxID=565073 RepID=A0A2V4MWU5_9ACTN|nr:PucR family transcriptional regulator [Streptomyces tateyamensis]